MKASEVVLRDFKVNDHGCRYERYLEAGVWSVNYVWSSFPGTGDLSTDATICWRGKLIGWLKGILIGKYQATLMFASRISKAVP